MMNKIVIYSAPNCPHCDNLEDYLKENDVDYNLINLGENPEKGEELVEKTGQMTVPVMIVKTDQKEKIVVGFNQKEIDKALENA